MFYHLETLFVAALHLGHLFSRLVVHLMSIKKLILTQCHHFFPDFQYQLYCRKGTLQSSNKYCKKTGFWMKNLRVMFRFWKWWSNCVSREEVLGLAASPLHLSDTTAIFCLHSTRCFQVRCIMDDLGFPYSTLRGRQLKKKPVYYETFLILPIFLNSNLALSSHFCRL